MKTCPNSGYQEKKSLRILGFLLPLKKMLIVSRSVFIFNFFHLDGIVRNNLISQSLITHPVHVST